METENQGTGTITRKEPFETTMFDEVKRKKVVSQYKTDQILKCRAKVRTTHVPVWMDGWMDFNVVHVHNVGTEDEERPVCSNVDELGGCDVT